MFRPFTPGLSGERGAGSIALCPENKVSQAIVTATATATGRRLFMVPSSCRTTAEGSPLARMQNIDIIDECPSIWRNISLPTIAPGETTVAFQAERLWRIDCGLIFDNI
jgi:hypothetical protein